MRDLSAVPAELSDAASPTRDHDRARARRALTRVDGPPAPANVPTCHRCAEPIDALDPVVALDGGDGVHVRCWRPPDPGPAAALPFAESPMPPLESFRSRPGRPAKRQPNGPALGLR